MYTINIENYSDKSFVVRGNDTVKFKDTLKELGGKWNSMLKNGGGWIFSNIHKKKIENFISLINEKENKDKQKVKNVDEDIIQNITIQKNENNFEVKGDTKIYKDKFKSLEGRWDIKDKKWVFPNSKLEEIENIVEEYDEIMSLNL